MRRIKISLLFLVLFLGLFYSTSAQYSQTLYNMNRIPQSSLMNPAIQPECNFFIGLPVISSTHVGVGNNRLTLSDVVKPHPTEDSLITFLHPLSDDKNILDKIKNSNYFYNDFQTTLLTFGFRADTWYFSLHAGDRQQLRVSYPKDLMQFALEGNDGFENTNMDFGNLGVNMSYFREYSLAASKAFSDQLTIGIRGKVLYGYGNVQTVGSDLSLYSSIDEINMAADMQVNVSGPVQATTNADGDFDGFEEIPDIDWVDYALDHQNMGMGVDLGVFYQPFSDLKVSASLVDLGYIKWDNNVTNLSLLGEYTFTGIDLTSEFDDDVSGDPMEMLLDSLENSFDLNNTAESYTTGLGTKVYIGANYYLSPKVDVAFLSRTVFYGSEMNQAFTLSANTRPATGLTASFSYSVLNGTYNNVGFGLILGGAPFQLYFMSDNFSAGLWGHKTSSFNFRFGLNFTFGCRKKIKDFPLLKSRL